MEGLFSIDIDEFVFLDDEEILGDEHLPEYLFAFWGEEVEGDDNF